MDTPTGRRAPRLPRRLAPGSTEGAAMADELRPIGSPPAIAALC